MSAPSSASSNPSSALPTDVAGGQPPPHPATPTQKIALASILAGSTILLLIVAGRILCLIPDVANQENSIAWDNPNGSTLRRPYPLGFQYLTDQNRNATDSDTSVGESNGLLSFRGPMSDETKKELLALYPSKPAGANDERYRQSLDTYYRAIDELGLASLEDASSYTLWLLLLGGLCGAIGVQLRSMWDFVRNASIKVPPQLDIITWWPWYAMRPVIGFVLGALAVSLIMSGLLNLDGQTPQGTLWWISVAVVVGYGSTEFMARLRAMVIALFSSSATA